MFSFGKKIFGRKGLDTGPAPSISQPQHEPAPNQQAKPEPWRPLFANPLDLTAEGIYARCVQLARAGKYEPFYYASAAVEGLSPAERAELLASTAPEAASMDRYQGGLRTREAWVSRCNNLCLENELQASRDHTPALLTLLTDDPRWLRHYYHKPFANLIRAIGQSIKDGGFLTSADSERLADLSARMRAAAEKEYSKANKKQLVLRAETVEKLGGVEVSATSLLLERCEGAHNPWALGEQPEHYAFWADLIAETVSGLHAITNDLRAKSSPAWFKDPAAFAAAWPAVGPIAPRFGAWNEAGDIKQRDFPVLRGYTKRRTKGQPAFAEPDRIRALPQLRERYAPTLEWRWDTPQIPALEVLADLESAEWTAIAEHLISGKVAPRPTAAWRKQAVKLAGAVGKDDVAQRLSAWLMLFHTPRLTPESLADRINVETMDRTVAHLNAQWPDLPARLAPEDLPGAGRALAMVLASEHHHGLPKPLSATLMECEDRIWEYKSATQGILRVKVDYPRQANGNSRYDGPQTWLKVSIENEALLRGAMWLAAELLPRAEAIDLLEAMALGGASRHSTGDQGHRSRVIANAAIATLIDLKGADVDAAVYRLSQAIPDRTINMPLFKALNRQAPAEPAEDQPASE